jgi:endogenous inhibitor of DNA gyrase (YacG/DUF329 family)
MVVGLCAYCDKPFRITIKGRRRKFCSKSCQKLAWRKGVRVVDQGTPKQMVAALADGTRTVSEVAEIVNVTASYVYNLRKELGLIFKTGCRAH